MKVQKNMVNITFQEMPQLFLMKFVIHIVSAVCVIIICVIIKKLIDINKIACILPIAVTAVISVLPFIVSAMGEVTGFIVAIFIDLTTWTVYGYSLVVMLCLAIAYTIGKAVKNN